MHFQRRFTIVFIHGTHCPKSMLSQPRIFSVSQDMPLDLVSVIKLPFKVKFIIAIYTALRINLRFSLICLGEYPSLRKITTFDRRATLKDAFLPISSLQNNPLTQLTSSLNYFKTNKLLS